MKISIHGGMAVGKTSLIKKLEKEYPDFGYSYEDLSEVIKQMKSLNLTFIARILLPLSLPYS